MRRVVVTGMGIVSSIGNNTQEVLSALHEARSGISRAEKFIDRRSHADGMVLSAEMARPMASARMSPVSSGWPSASAAGPAATTSSPLATTPNTTDSVSPVGASTDQSRRFCTRAAATPRSLT